MIKAILFDLNGVLLQSELLSKRFNTDFHIAEPTFLAALKNIMTTVRKPHAPTAFSLWQPYLQAWKIPFNEQQFFNYWFTGEHPNQPLINLLAKIKSQNIKLIILSNNFKERTLYYQKNHTFLSAFDAQYYSWQTGFVKPNNLCFEKIFHEHNLQPQECLYVDDSQENVECAKQLHVTAHKYKDVPTLIQLLETSNITL